MSGEPTSYVDFDAAIAEDEASRQGEKVVGFKLGGEQFQIPLPLPAAGVLRLGVLSDMGMAVGFVGDGAAVVRAMAELVKFLDAIVAEADQARFEAALTRSRASFEVLIQMVKYIVEEATGRPLVPASSSPVAPSDPGLTSNPATSEPTSKVVSLSEGTVDAVLGEQAPAGVADS